MEMSRPSTMIYLRRDPGQVWKECDGPYELGYLCGMADRRRGWIPATVRECDNMTGTDTDYRDGYNDGYNDVSL